MIYCLIRSSNYFRQVNDRNTTEEESHRITKTFNVDFSGTILDFVKGSKTYLYRPQTKFGARLSFQKGVSRILFTGGGGGIPACIAGDIPACLAGIEGGGGIPACFVGGISTFLAWGVSRPIPRGEAEGSGQVGGSTYKARHAHKRLYTVLPKYSKIQVLPGITSCRLVKDNKQAIELNSLLINNMPEGGYEWN